MSTGVSTRTCARTLALTATILVGAATVASYSDGGSSATTTASTAATPVS